MMILKCGLMSNAQLLSIGSPYHELGFKICIDLILRIWSPVAFPVYMSQDNAKSEEIVLNRL